MLRKEDSIGELWDNPKWSNVCVPGVPEGEGRKENRKKKFEKILAEKFPKPMIL